MFWRNFVPPVPRLARKPMLRVPSQGLWHQSSSETAEEIIGMDFDI